MIGLGGVSAAITVRMVGFLHQVCSKPLWYVLESSYKGVVQTTSLKFQWFLQFQWSSPYSQNKCKPFENCTKLSPRKKHIFRFEQCVCASHSKEWSTPPPPRIIKPHLPKKGRPRCYTKSPTAQDMLGLAQYQAPSARLGWPGDGDYYLMKDTISQDMYGQYQVSLGCPRGRGEWYHITDEYQKCLGLRNMTHFARDQKNTS